MKVYSNLQVRNYHKSDTILRWTSWELTVLILQWVPIQVTNLRRWLTATLIVKWNEKPWATHKQSKLNCIILTGHQFLKGKEPGKKNEMVETNISYKRNKGLAFKTITYNLWKVKTHSKAEQDRQMISSIFPLNLNKLSLRTNSIVF